MNYGIKMPKTKKISKNFGKNFVTKSGIPRSHPPRQNDPVLLRDFKEEFKKEKEEKEAIELKELLYGKGQGGKGRGLMQEVDLPTRVEKKDQPYQMKTTTAKASWRK